jgi:hypothetical protein
MTMVCYGGLSTGGQVLADTWMLTVDSVDKLKRRLSGTWKRIDVGNGAIGGRHSFSMVATPPSAADDAREGFLVVGGLTSDASGSLSVPLSDVWMLVVSNGPSCSGAPAAWHRLFPALQPGNAINRGVAAALSTAGDMLAFGGDLSQQHHVTDTPSPLASSSLQMLRKDTGCLHPSTALGKGCPGATEVLHACRAAASVANLTLSWDMGTSRLLEHVKAPAVIDILDSEGQPLVPSQENPFYTVEGEQQPLTEQPLRNTVAVHCQPNPSYTMDGERHQPTGWCRHLRSAVTANPAKERTAASSSSRVEALVTNVPYPPGTRVRAIVSILGMQVAETGLVALPDRMMHRLELRNAPQRPLTLSSPDGLTHSRTQLSVAYRGKRTAWPEVIGDASQLNDHALLWQVPTPHLLKLLSYQLCALHCMLDHHKAGWPTIVCGAIAFESNRFFSTGRSQQITLVTFCVSEQCHEVSRSWCRSGTLAASPQLMAPTLKSTL